MSMDLMVKAMKTKVGHPLRKLVLVKLADNASDLGECWPSYQHIADQCEISRSTVKVHIRELEKAGLLRREFRKNGDMNQSNVFHLQLDGGAEYNRGGAGRALPGAESARGGGAESALITSHSFEPVNEPSSDSESEGCKKIAPQQVGDQGKPDPLEGFDQFYRLYPKRQKRADAEKAWSKLKPADRQAAMQALPKHCQLHDWIKDGGQYVPLPASWLNGKRWQDELSSDSTCAVPAEAIVDLYHKACPTCSPVTVLDHGLHKLISDRWSESQVHQDMGFWEAFLMQAGRIHSLYYQGQHQRPYLESMLSRSNFRDIVEGRANA